MYAEISLSAFMFQVKDHPVKAQPADMAASIILSKEPTLKVCLFFFICFPVSYPG